MKYDAVIFDKDGVLLDSMEDNYLWADKLRVKIAEQKGLNLTLEDVRGIVKVKSPEELEEFSRYTGLNRDEIVQIERKISERKIEN